MIKFGPSGNESSFYEQGNKHTVDAPKWLKDRGLNCYEYSFGRGINLKDEKAVEIGDAFFKQGIEVSVHAPYYINFANPDDEMAKKSYNYVIESAKKVKLMGGKRIVFHSATQGKMERNEALSITADRMKRLAELIYKENLQDMIFCPETMGKLAQIGTIEEVANLCLIDKVFVPAIDFGHVNAREQGSLKCEKDYLDRLTYVKQVLGDRINLLHVHFSKIEYGLKGEIKHLTFEDTVYGPEFLPFAKALKAMGLEPYIICESDGMQATDAVKMKNIYESLR